MSADTIDGDRPGSDLIVVVGATGTGKSDLALDLAERLDAAGRSAEVVNADAMQLYRGMDIGTAKLREGDRRGVPHHLLDVWDVRREASVADYQLLAREAINEILGRGNVPILVGGSGLYVSGAVFDFRFPGRDDEVRSRLEAELDVHGRGDLFRRLVDLDPRAAEAIGPHNARRIVRALEVIELTGDTNAARLPDEPVWWRPASIVGLAAPRAELVNRLDARVDRMWEEGMLAEVESLLPLGLAEGVTSSRAIGYTQAIRQLAGEIDEREAVETTQALTRRYARRQVSWFKRYPRTSWFDFDRPRIADVVAAAFIDGDHSGASR